MVCRPRRRQRGRIRRLPARSPAPRQAATVVTCGGILVAPPECVNLVTALAVSSVIGEGRASGLGKARQRLERRLEVELGQLQKEPAVADEEGVRDADERPADEEGEGVLPAWRMLRGQCVSRTRQLCGHIRVSAKRRPAADELSGQAQSGLNVEIAAGEVALQEVVVGG